MAYELGSNPRIKKKSSNVLQSASDVVESVLAFAGTVQVARDGHGVVFTGQQTLAVFKSKGYISHPGTLLFAGTIKDDIRHLLKAQIFLFLLAQHPPNGIDNVGFPTAVGAYHSCDVFFEMNGRSGWQSS